MTSPPDSPAVGHLDRTSQHTWALFADWCCATGHVALPAQPETLAEFLADHPARVTTHRRRVAGTCGGPWLGPAVKIGTIFTAGSSHGPTVKTIFTTASIYGLVVMGHSPQP